MKKTEMARVLSQFADHLSNFAACQFGKLKRKPFPKLSWRAFQKLQLIHTDIGEPQKTPSLKGNRYYILFIDDFTRK